MLCLSGKGIVGMSAEELDFGIEEIKYRLKYITVDFKLCSEMLEQLEFEKQRRCDNGNVEL